MAKNEVKIEWIQKMSFSSSINGHNIILDADDKVGGEDKGPRPKPLLLLSLAGCTGMDVASFLKKMRVNYDAFRVLVSGELTEEHPKTYHSMHIIYEFKGSDLDMKKIEKSISLSQDKYCGVSAMFKNAGVKITSEIKII